MTTAHPDIVAERLHAAGVDPPPRRDLLIEQTEKVERLNRTLTEARLLAELWVRNTDEGVRRMGADLMQVLDG